MLLVSAATRSSIEGFVEIHLWSQERMDFLRHFLTYEPGFRPTIRSMTR
jgi:hypothetical protein